MADVTRPSGGCEGCAGRVIPHYVGPATLLRHFLPAHPSQPLSFADLIKVSYTRTRQEGFRTDHTAAGSKMSFAGNPSPLITNLFAR